jgi:tetratricopeptide (TPR) repeat protein
MIARELRLERTSQPQRTARAWLIDGADPARWLAEIARWRIADERLALHVLPRSRQDRAAGGLFVIASGEATPAVQPAALAFGTIADRCWLPVDAVLRPAVTAAEVGAFCKEAPLIFHPALGPVLADRDAALRVADLLAVPTAMMKAWRGAPIISLAHPRIESIAFRVTLLLADVFGEESREIGIEPPDDLPRAPGEPSNHPLARGLRGVAHGMLGAAQWTLDHLPLGNTAGGMLDGMGRWVEEHLGAIARQLALSRHSALLRLLEELKTNPEAGLRHALPLNDAALHRGIAPPTNRLGTRESDFDLRRLGGGRRRDAWEVPADVRAQLRQRYLELAERERQLGRFRRAACIYAELLGDLHAAAASLAEGGYWQEAALVHRDHLHNALEAARCFAAGRMFAEAVRIYEEQDAYEQLGVLHRALGDEEKAQRAFRKWVERLITLGDLIDAASVLETKLNAREEALDLLDSAWPLHPQAFRCVERSLAMRGPRGEHAAAARSLARIEAGPMNDGFVLLLLDVFARLQMTYPDRQIRAQAEDLGRRLITTRITGRDPKRRAHFVQKLAELAPDDRLLAQDGHRFLDQNSAKAQPAAARKSTPLPVGNVGPAEVFELGQILLPHRRTTWRVAVGCREGAFVLGTDGDSVRAARVHFDGEVQDASWRPSLISALTEHLILSAPAHSLGERVFAAVRGFRLLNEIELPAGNGFATTVSVGNPNWVAECPLAAVHASDGTLWVLDGSDEQVLKGYAADGSLRGHFAIPPAQETANVEDVEPVLPPPLAAIGAELLLAKGSQLHRLSSESQRAIIFDEPIAALATPPRWGTPHVAVALRTEVHVCWLGRRAGLCHRVSSGLGGPVIGYSADGTLIVLAGEAGYLIDCDSRGQRREARFDWQRAPALAIVPGPTARMFGVVSMDGRIHWLRFSAECLR